MGFIASSKAPGPTLVFTDKDLPPEGPVHNKPLYISLKCLTKWIALVLVDNGSALKLCPRRTINKLGVDASEIRSSNQGAGITILREM